MKTPDIDSSWLEVIGDEFQKPYMQEISAFLKAEVEAGHTIYPHPKNIFAVLNTTHFDEVKVVILGQDPYHGAGQAHGLSFSVQEWVKYPPSLRNIFKELESDLGITCPNPPQSPLVRGEAWKCWILSPWAKQWVLMLNAILTVGAGSPASHSKIGWGQFTDTIIQKISEKKSGVVFILWWGFARGKKSLIDTTKHHIIESPHPSPFSAYNGFFSSKPFSKTNEALKRYGKKPINWEL